MNEKIAALLKEPDEIEKEIFDTEVIQDEIHRTSSKISNFLDIPFSMKTQTLFPLILWDNRYLYLMGIHQWTSLQEVMINPH